jgi:hypothetical protein
MIGKFRWLARYVTGAALRFTARAARSSEECILGVWTVASCPDGIQHWWLHFCPAVGNEMTRSVVA